MPASREESGFLDLSARIAISALGDSEAAILLLDAMEADPARRTAAVGVDPPVSTPKASRDASDPRLRPCDA